MEGREGFRFVRLPDQKRIYAARVNIDLSTDFKDWIDTDLLKVDKNKIDRVELRDYSINERTLSVVNRDKVILTRQDGTWRADKMKTNEVVDSTKMKELLNALDELTIVGVRPKPKGLSASLRKSSPERKKHWRRRRHCSFCEKSSMRCSRDQRKDDLTRTSPGHR